ncbi:hypothetical protein FNV43_RR00034 [Rhamnella rubrinervis]|uniref:Uncharacterized protein n=1 Tax=Rhamnella rubrinervis TaxID=2594499 RepID=A0A8K0HNE8_9ROSA|nr:hypothetical protein FNV43_RR00034 [Rhamnella rubrinervis]
MVQLVMFKVLVLDLSQLEKGIDYLRSKKEEVEDRAKAAEERNEELMARQDSIEQSKLERIRADVQTHFQRARLFVDTPFWMQDNTQDGAKYALLLGERSKFRGLQVASSR